MNIIGDKVCLRAMELEDMECFRNMLNNPEIENMLGGWSTPVSMYQQEEWYKRVINDNRNFRWSVIKRDDQELIGMVNLVDIDWKNGTGFHGIRLLPGEKYRHQGYGTDAVNTLMSYAFEELRLNRLETTIIEYNHFSQALYHKCGWSIEGTKRMAVYRNGRYFDLLVLGVLAYEWEERKEK